MMINNQSPKLAVDAIILIEGKVVLIERKNPPQGWAFPGGFVDYGETVEAAVIREIEEETSLLVVPTSLKQIHTYSSPKRDPRGHVVSIVFSCEVEGVPKAQDDAKNIGLFSLNQLPELAFDHKDILNAYTKNMLKKDIEQKLEYSKKDVSEKFLMSIRNLVVFWDRTTKKSTKEKLDGLACCILAVLDGCSVDLPGFIVAPDPHESDKVDSLTNNTKYYPENYDITVNCDIAGTLHEHYYMEKK